MTISTGDRFPSATVTIVDADGTRETTTDALFEGRRVVLFAVPGAFTPTCSERHLPGFVDNVDALAAKGVQAVVCLAVNDVFVLKAWATATGALGKILMLADGSGTLTRALGLELDLSSRGLGVRAQRFAMVVDDMMVTQLGVESAGSYGASSAEAILGGL